MIVSVVACGASAQYYDGSGFSIGVNDAFKWGHKLNFLLVVNHPTKFRSEPERFDTITQSKPEKFISHSSAWRTWFPNLELIRLYTYHSRADKFRIYHSQTSPFVAISYAVTMGATDIILWGVDFIDHKIFRAESKKQRYEVDVYHQFINSISKHGVRVWLGAEGSALELPLWKKTEAVSL